MHARCLQGGGAEGVRGGASEAAGQEGVPAREDAREHPPEVRHREAQGRQGKVVIQEGRPVGARGELGSTFHPYYLKQK